MALAVGSAMGDFAQKPQALAKLDDSTACVGEKQLNRGHGV